ncbi:MAG: hypothetical protein IPK82_11145 [Polyangiaceae bacterium]|nr:hypothetical protein [Polyangiaceae bacterium]
MTPSFLKNARNAFLERVGENLKREACAEGVLKDVQKVQYEHGGSTKFADVQGTLRSSDWNIIDSQMRIETAILESGDASQFRKAIAKVTAEFRHQMTSQMLRTISTAASEAGNTVNLGGRPLTADALCGMFERIHIEFDKDGCPKMPSLMLPPEVMEQARRLLELPEVKFRLYMILQEKWVSRYSLRST